MTSDLKTSRCSLFSWPRLGRDRYPPFLQPRFVAARGWRFLPRPCRSPRARHHPCPGPIRDVAPGQGRGAPPLASVAGGRVPRPLAGLLAGFEGLVGDGVLLGGAAELAQLRRD